MSRRLPAISVGAALALAAPAPALAADGEARQAESAAAPATDAGLDFTQGQRAFAAGDYRAAATAFEEAYRKKPHHASLWNAGRSWQRAGEVARAANLYARYLVEAPADARDRDHATDALRELGPRLVRLDIHGAEAESVRVDGEAIRGDSVYVHPGDHLVEGRVRGQLVRRTVRGPVGGAFSVVLEPEARLPAPPPERPDGARASFHVPWGVAIAAGALTVVAGGLTLWSGLDTLDKRDAFLEAPTRDKLDDGKERQLRTNILVGVTAGLGLATAVTMFFVDWRGSRASAVRVAPAVADGGGMIVVRTSSR